jgi:hypothetical protein
MTIFNKQEKAIIDNDLYFEILEVKGVKFIEIYRTVNFQRIKSRRISIKAKHVWSHGDKLFKLASRYYGDISKFWIIGLINKRPTDGHYKIGDEVLIPSDIGLIENLVGNTDVSIQF